MSSEAVVGGHGRRANTSKSKAVALHCYMPQVSVIGRRFSVERSVVRRLTCPKCEDKHPAMGAPFDAELSMTARSVQLD